MTNLEIVQSWFAASQKGDAAGVRAPLADGVSWTLSEGYPAAGVYQGVKDVCEGMMPAFFAHFSSFRPEPDNFYDAGETIVAVGHYVGTRKAKGTDFRVAFNHVWTLEQGKVVRFHQLINTAEMIAALGPEGAKSLGTATAPFRRAN